MPCWLLYCLKTIQKKGTASIDIVYAADTFKIEWFMTKWIAYDDREFCIREAINTVANLYDSLLNKYYKRLNAELKGEPKKSLIQAQRAWLTFRDSETKLVYTISKTAYSGVGTKEQLTEAYSNLDMLKTRTHSLYKHLVRATQNE